MAYILRNIETGKTVTVEENVWKDILSSAEDNGWYPEGTTLDLPAMIDDVCDEADDYNYDSNYNLWMMAQMVHFSAHWNGNYTDKENQIVDECDGANMSYYLSGCEFDDEIVDFLCDGAFVICAP